VEGPEQWREPVGRWRRHIDRSPMGEIMESVVKYQRQLLDLTRSIHYETPISDAVASAYLATPRHVFVKRYRQWGTKAWHEVCEANVAEHLATLYANGPLILFGDDDDDVPSTISQPSFVLHMLDLLQLRPGQAVFELGAGSGWNAALMGHLVSPGGHVHSLELIPEVARMAMDSIEALGIANVHIVEADGGEGYAAGAPYDRAIFTAGTYDLPRHFYEQMRDRGLLLIVIKNAGGGDNLFLLRKTADHFESVESEPCGFVQLRGKYAIKNLEPTPLELLPEWPELRQHEVSRTPFWWGGKGKAGLVWRTLGIRSFLGITEPAFRAFKTEKAETRARAEHFFGLWDQAQQSLVVAKDDCLIAYGSAVAKERLLQQVRQWVDLGMPSAACLTLQVYPSDVSLMAGEHEWLVKRPESQFLWSLRR
jgi:protein-L-isoaspartate(D-aspartate) O-methyltransferase